MKKLNLKSGTYKYNSHNPKTKEILLGLDLNMWLFELLKEVGLNPVLPCTDLTNCGMNNLFIKQGTYKFLNKSQADYFDIDKYFKELLINLNVMPATYYTGTSFKLIIADGIGDVCEGYTNTGSQITPILITGVSSLATGVWQSGNANIIPLTGTFIVGEAIRTVDTNCYKLTQILNQTVISCCSTKSKLHILKSNIVPFSKKTTKEVNILEWLIKTLNAYGITVSCPNC